MAQKYIAGLEIGSSHIKIAVGTIDDAGILTLIGVEQESAVDIVRYGTIQNLDELSNRVRLLIKRIENRNGVSPHKLNGLYVAVGGRSTMSNNRQVERQYADETEITAEAVEQIKAEAKNNSLSERVVIDVLPRDYVIDNLEVHRPVGTFGKHIVADINLISCKHKIIRNIEHSLAKIQNIALKGLVVRQVAEADLVLSPDEKALGCMLVDFGAETTTVSVYKNGTLHYLATLPLGSRNITRDIMSLHHTEERAEEIKRAIGDAVNIEPAGHKHDFDGDPVEVNNFIRARAGEIAVNITQQAAYAGFTKPGSLGGGIVLIGAGAKLRGFAELIAKQSDMKVRLGSIPNTIRISDPRLQASEHVDIVALLASVAAHNPADCTEPVPDPVHNDPSSYAEDEDGPGHRPVKGHRKEAEKERKEKQPDDGRGLGSRLSVWLRKAASDIFNDPDDD